MEKVTKALLTMKEDIDQLKEVSGLVSKESVEQAANEFVECIV